MQEFLHQSVLLKETIELLNPQPGKTFVDCTLGGGGHTEEILKRMNGNGLVIGLDQDKQALHSASERLKVFGDSFKAVNANFSQIDTVLHKMEIDRVDGVLFDLGVSSPQLDWEDRGFSYWGNADLDMRMNLDQEGTATDLLRELSEGELTTIFRDYGEEKWASRISKFIVETRKMEPIRTSDQLVNVIKAAIPASARREGGHPAKRVFQALRIAVNRELDVLQIGLEKALFLLRPDGVLDVISFHSLEDRIVKQFMKNQVHPCTCPPKIPVCVCGRKPTLRLLTNKPIIAGQEELSWNPRAKSAKLRAAMKLATPVKEER